MAVYYKWVSNWISSILSHFYLSNIVGLMFAFLIIMNKIDVKLFANLGEELGFSEKSFVYKPDRTVAQLWSIVSDGKPVPSNLLCARNMEYCKLETLVEEGDEIAFFPPVSGG